MEYETDSWYAALSNKTLEPVLRVVTSWGEALGDRRSTYKPKGNVVFGYVEKTSEPVDQKPLGSSKNVAFSKQTKGSVSGSSS